MLFLEIIRQKIIIKSRIQGSYKEKRAFNIFEEDSVGLQSCFVHGISNCEDGSLQGQFKDRKRLECSSDQCISMNGPFISQNKYVVSQVNHKKGLQSTQKYEQYLQFQPESDTSQKSHQKRSLLKITLKSTETSRNNNQKLKIQNDSLKRMVQQLKFKLFTIQQELRYVKFSNKTNGKMFDNLFQTQRQSELNKIIEYQSLQPLEKYGEKNSWRKIKDFAIAYGLAGKEKFNLLSYYMSEILDNLVNDYHKRLIIRHIKRYKSRSQDQSFNSQYMRVFDQKDKQFLCIDEYKLKELRDRFYDNKQLGNKIIKFHQSSQQFYSAYIILINKAVQVKSCFNNFKDDFTDSVAPKNYLELINWYEKNRFGKDIQEMRRYWFTFISSS